MGSRWKIKGTNKNAWDVYVKNISFVIWHSLFLNTSYSAANRSTHHILSIYFSCIIISTQIYHRVNNKCITSDTRYLSSSIPFFLLNHKDFFIFSIVIIYNTLRINDISLKSLAISIEIYDISRKKITWFPITLLLEIFHGKGFFLVR